MPTLLQWVQFRGVTDQHRDRVLNSKLETQMYRAPFASIRRNLSSGGGVGKWGPHGWSSQSSATALRVGHLTFLDLSLAICEMGCTGHPAYLKLVTRLMWLCVQRHGAWWLGPQPGSLTLWAGILAPHMPAGPWAIYFPFVFSSVKWDLNSNPKLIPMTNWNHACSEFSTVLGTYSVSY